jgi:hypothetical protein
LLKTARDFIDMKICSEMHLQLFVSRDLRVESLLTIFVTPVKKIDRFKSSTRADKGSKRLSRSVEPSQGLGSS